jgi:hypothetical protein
MKRSIIITVENTRPINTLARGRRAWMSWGSRRVEYLMTRGFFLRQSAIRFISARSEPVAQVSGSPEVFPKKLASASSANRIIIEVVASGSRLVSKCGMGEFIRLKDISRLNDAVRFLKNGVLKALVEEGVLKQRFLLRKVNN